MKNLRIILRSLVIPIIFLALFSCVDTDMYNFHRLSDEIEITPGISMPALKGSFTLDDILGEIKSTENVGKFPDDSLIYLTFSDEITSYQATDGFKIQDQNFLTQYISSDISTNPLWTGSNIGDTIVFSKQKDGEIVVTNNEKIDSVKIKSSSLRIDLASTFKHRGILKVFSENIKINGQPFTRTINITSSSGTFVFSDILPVSNATLTFDNTDPAVTVLPLKFELYLINSGAPVQAGDQCLVSMTLKDIVFSSAFGYLGNYTLPVHQDGQTDLKFYNNFIGDGELFFADPRFSVCLNNSYGVPVEITLSEVKAYSEKSNITTPIIFGSGVNPFKIKVQDIDHIGEFVQDTVTLDKNSCNIVQAIETSPNIFYYQILAETNPDGPGQHYDFITDSSRVDINFEVVLPLWIRAQGVSIKDTIEFDFDDMDEVYDYINTLRFTVEGKNEFPLKTGLQVLFTDSLYTVMDSLFTGSSVLLNPAPVGTDGKITGPADYKKVSEYSKSRLDKIKNTKMAIIRVDLDTSNATSGQYIKFYSYYKLDFKLSLKANLRINSRDI